MTAPGHELETIAADGRINVVSPLDGRVLERIPMTPPEDVPALFERARQAQRQWQKRSVAARARALKPLARGIADAADELVELLREEIGRHPAESWFAEIVPNIDLIHWWVRQGRKHLEPQRVKLNPINFPGKKAWIELVPRGVLGLITPWNYPVSIPLRALIPALLAGNAVVWKPSEYAALVSKRLDALFSEFLDPDLVVLAQGAGPTGAAVVEHCDGIGFTGSYAVGQQIAVRAAERLIPSSLELGGKDFAVVCPDANLPRAAAGIAWAGLTNAGQNCASIEVVCVHESVAAEFTSLLRDEVQKMAPFVGPMINARQKQKVAAQLDDAIRSGGLVLIGGEGDADGLRIDPAVIEHPDWNSALMCEETFGPVLPVVTWRDLAEVSEQLARSAYGLTLSVWSADVDSAVAWARQQPAGVLTVNNHSFTAGIAEMPWTGVRQSGLGVTNSVYALEWMTRPRGVLIDRNKQREPWWHPYNDAAVTMARGISDLNTGRRPFWRALPDLLKGFLTRWK
ncbi:MAG: aldehyde dehydrogenase family protein [Candidatus Dadabacteria bacterium]|nr:MAG: aldehyde dehydrogenase family protein [Candidatus Dadabacteria bacterium]